MIASLKKINIVALHQYQEKILEVLQSMGVAHIVQKTNPAKESESAISAQIDETKYLLANIKFAINFLHAKSTTKISFKDKLTATRTILTYAQIERQVKKININEIIGKLTALEKNLEQTRSKLLEIDKKIIELDPWLTLKDLPQETKYTNITIGTIPTVKAEPFADILAANDQLVVETLTASPKDTYLQITYLKQAGASVKELLNLHNFQAKTPDSIELPLTELAKLKKEHAQLKSAQKKYRVETKEYAQFLEPLKMAEDFYSWKLDKLNAKTQTTKTKYFLIIKCWVKKDNVTLLKNALRQISREIFLKPIKTRPNENPPVIIDNSGFMRPFETVTNLYGLPRYRELDPTPYLAPFFIVFFAVCLTDAGYGAVMALTAFLIIKIFKIPREKQKLFRLIGYGGILTIIIGALFGGWFGVDVAKIGPGHLKSFIEFFQIIDPMKQTLLFMLIAFGLGLIHLWFARIVRAISAVKNKNKGDMVSAIGWATFILTLIMLIGSSQLSWPRLTAVLIYCLITVLIALVFVESRETKNIFVKPLVGSVKIIQELIGVMSDTLSYSRLMALGLATGIIALIINTIAGIMRDLIPYVGWIVWVLILIGGHIFNIGINALGAFIHSSRLQFVEFFPKFMEGGGVRFIPFRKSSKYFEIKP
ncbi:MAG: hypothetical protein A2445_01765 [Candidatus Jacksonbacteria bacterium RIFOXYC2_FULL_44_29]|nr:MAG: V-type sodium ATP synthase subunit I [Parcubacteria group bacterium GW2011_GWC2_44_22]OGY75584.1 MAG: hypothetical protein A2295_05190 [Candidatus Jacksonbacteria bacterium RIFOXYB2_FULL_44_15]OGY75678.1 MAG: hypothetical protein A2240_03965 [Candidatus Jacksonbacteria bacterium RIFOXYA2_FULL_43_12]OGY77572.1 MAG: hypothetical protein A2445_01765 [Candidatus Jacksonbacteria bacterium RIFOXYC2_FULL_44_29]OGY81756.1 MAG: hypothetical protein A2550_01135 [Candidatus Jacksonbacteria bacteri